MARPKMPKMGEVLTLKRDGTEIDFHVTNVTHRSTMGDTALMTIEGIPFRERAVDNATEYTGGSYPANGVGNYITTSGSLYIQPNPTPQTWTFEKTSQGMTVEIKTYETIDGTKAQIVLTVGSKKVIVWESEAFQDEGDFKAEVVAKEDAEEHAKTVLKNLFK